MLSAFDDVTSRVHLGSGAVLLLRQPVLTSKTFAMID